MEDPSNPSLRLKLNLKTPFDPGHHHVGYHYAWADKEVSMTLLPSGLSEFLTTRVLSEAELRHEAQHPYEATEHTCVEDGKLCTRMLLSLQTLDCLVHFSQQLVLSGPRPTALLPTITPTQDPDESEGLYAPII